jgi:hypothetical protein
MSLPFSLPHYSTAQSLLKDSSQEFSKAESKKKKKKKKPNQPKKPKPKTSQAVVVHAFSHSAWEAEAGGFLSSRPAWSTK